MKQIFIVILISLVAPLTYSLERPGVEFKIFQFPADAIPRIDGNPEDWDMVPNSYAIGTDELRDVQINKGAKADPEN